MMSNDHGEQDAYIALSILGVTQRLELLEEVLEAARHLLQHISVDKEATRVSMKNTGYEAWSAVLNLDDAVQAALTAHQRPTQDHAESQQRREDE